MAEERNASKMFHPLEICLSRLIDTVTFSTLQLIRKNDGMKFTERFSPLMYIQNFSKFTPDSNKLQANSGSVCILRHDPPRETQVSQVRPEVRVATDHGKSRRNRQATRLGGNLVAREATFTEGGRGIGERKLLCRTSFCPSCASRANRAGVHNLFRFRRRRRETIEYA